MIKGKGHFTNCNLKAWKMRCILLGSQSYGMHVSNQLGLVLISKLAWWRQTSAVLDMGFHEWLLQMGMSTLHVKRAKSSELGWSTCAQYISSQLGWRHVLGYWMPFRQFIHETMSSKSTPEGFFFDIHIYIPTMPTMYHLKSLAAIDSAILMSNIISLISGEGPGLGPCLDRWSFYTPGFLTTPHILVWKYETILSQPCFSKRSRGFERFKKSSIPNTFFFCGRIWGVLYELIICSFIVQPNPSMRFNSIWTLVFSKTLQYAFEFCVPRDDCRYSIL